MQLDPQLQKIQDFLTADSRRQIRVVNDDTSEFLTKKITLDQILTQAANVQEFIQNLYLKNSTLKKITIQQFRSNGSKTIKTNDENTITWKNTNTKLPLGEGRSGLGASEHDAPTEQVIHPQLKQTNTMDPNFPEMTPQNFQSFGLGLVEQIDLRTKAKEREYLIQENQRLQDKLRNLEQKNDDLHSELREAKSDLRVAEKDKALDIKMMEMQKKPFVDPDTLRTIMESAPSIMAAVMGQRAAMPGLGNVQGLSEAKTQLINEIQKGSFSEDMTQSMISLMMVLMNGNPQSKELLVQAINLFNAQFQQ